MGNAECVCLVSNMTDRVLCGIIFHDLDAIRTSYISSFTIEPRSEHKVKLKGNPGISRMQVGIITDANQMERKYTYDVWWVNTECNLKVTEIDSRIKNVRANGGKAAVCKGQKLEYYEGNAAIFSYIISALLRASPVYSPRDSAPNYLSAVACKIENRTGKNVYGIWYRTTSPPKEIFKVAGNETYNFYPVSNKVSATYVLPAAYLGTGLKFINSIKSKQMRQHLTPSAGAHYIIDFDRVSGELTCRIQRQESPFLKVVVLPHRNKFNQPVANIRSIARVFHSHDYAARARAVSEESELPILTQTPSTVERLATGCDLEHIHHCAIASDAIYGNSICPSKTLTCDGWQFICGHDAEISDGSWSRWAIWRTSSAPSMAYLVFRGTDMHGGTYQDFITNASSLPKQIFQHARFGASFATAGGGGKRATDGGGAGGGVGPTWSGWSVHSGYYTSVENVYLSIVQALWSHDIDEFYVTGHSLGGALAQTFALFYLTLQPPNSPQCSIPAVSVLKHAVTFGAPMIAYNRDDVPVAQAPPEYHRWISHCTNYVYRADPVAYAPRAVACRFGWNAYIGLAAGSVRSKGSKSMVGKVAGGIIDSLTDYSLLPGQVSSCGEVPAGHTFHTLANVKFYSPVGSTVLLLAKSDEDDADFEVTAEAAAAAASAANGSDDVGCNFTDDDDRDDGDSVAEGAEGWSVALDSNLDAAVYYSAGQSREDTYSEAQQAWVDQDDGEDRDVANRRIVTAVEQAEPVQSVQREQPAQLTETARSSEAGQSPPKARESGSISSLKSDPTPTVGQQPPLQQSPLQRQQHQQQQQHEEEGAQRTRSRADDCLSMMLSRDAMRDLAMTLDTFLDPKDGFVHHKMKSYIAALRRHRLKGRALPDISGMPGLPSMPGMLGVSEPELRNDSAAVSKLQTRVQPGAKPEFELRAQPGANLESALRAQPGPNPESESKPIPVSAEASAEEGTGHGVQAWTAVETGVKLRAEPGLDAELGGGKTPAAESMIEFGSTHVADFSAVSVAEPVAAPVAEPTTKLEMTDEPKIASSDTSSTSDTSNTSNTNNTNNTSNTSSKNNNTRKLFRRLFWPRFIHSCKQCITCMAVHCFVCRSSPCQLTQDGGNHTELYTCDICNCPSDSVISCTVNDCLPPLQLVAPGSMVVVRCGPSRDAATIGHLPSGAIVRMRPLPCGQFYQLVVDPLVEPVGERGEGGEGGGDDGNGGCSMAELRETSDDDDEDGCSATTGKAVWDSRENGYGDDGIGRDGSRAEECQQGRVDDSNHCVLAETTQLGVVTEGATAEGGFIAADGEGVSWIAVPRRTVKGADADTGRERERGLERELESTNKPCGHLCGPTSLVNCCACEDERPLQEEGTYPQYRSDEGWIDAGWRAEGYCYICSEQPQQRWKLSDPALAGSIAADAAATDYEWPCCGGRGQSASGCIRRHVGVLKWSCCKSVSEDALLIPPQECERAKANGGRHPGRFAFECCGVQLAATYTAMGASSRTLKTYGDNGGNGDANGDDNGDGDASSSPPPPPPPVAMSNSELDGCSITHPTQYHPGPYRGEVWECCREDNLFAVGCRRGRPSHHDRWGGWNRFLVRGQGWVCCENKKRDADGCRAGRHPDPLKYTS